MRLAGGEPLLREEVVAIVETFAHQAGIGVVAMTTDGVQLARFAEPLLFAGLQRLTITLDSLDRETYQQLTGRDALPQVLAGLRAVKPLPFQQVCVEMTVRRGRNDSEIPAFIELARETGFTVRFSELPREGDEEEWEAEFVSAAEIRTRLLAYGCALESKREMDRAALPGGGYLEVFAPVSEGPTRDLAAPPRQRVWPPDRDPQARARRGPAPVDRVGRSGGRRVREAVRAGDERGLEER